MSQPQTPTGNASAEYDAGRAYMSDVAKAAFATVVGDFELASERQADADSRLWPLAEWDANQLRDFIAGVTRAAEQHQASLRQERAAPAFAGENRASHTPNP